MKRFFITFIVSVCFIITTAQKSFYNIDSHPVTIHQECDILTKNSLHTSFEVIERGRIFVPDYTVLQESILQVGDTLILDLFYNQSYSSVIVSSFTDINYTYTFAAKLIGYDFAYIYMSISNGTSYLYVSIPEENGQYFSRYNGNQLYLCKTDMNKTKFSEGDHISVPSVANNSQPQINQKDEQSITPSVGQTNNSQEKTNAIVDIIFFYTPAAQTWANANAGNINNVVSSIITQSNTVLGNSATQMTFNLVHSRLMNYTEGSSMSQDLDRFTFHAGYDPWNVEGTPRYLEEVHTIRNNYGADLCMLLTDALTPGPSGTAYLLEDRFGTPDLGFSVTDVKFATSSYTAIHEAGHNMGAHHHKLQNYQPGPTIWTNWATNTWSSAWRWTGTNSIRYCSIMSYTSGIYFSDGNNHNRVPYFSNPDINYFGATGSTASGANNARTIRELRHIIEAYRAPVSIFPPGPITSNSPQCAGTGVTFTRTQCPVGATCYWQTSATGTSTANSSVTYTTSGNVGSYTMYLRAYDGVFWSPAESVLGSVKSLPAAPGAISSNSPQYAGTGVTFTRGTCPSLSTCYWQTTSTGTSTANSSATYTTSAQTGTYTMYLRAQSIYGCWGASTSVTGQVVPLVNPPGNISNNSPQCSGTPITFTRSSCPTGAVCYWQTSPTGTSTANSSITYTTNTIAGTYTMYLRAHDGFFWSDAVSSIGTINQTPAQPAPITNNSPQCSGTPITFTAGLCPSGSTCYWQSSSTGTSTINSSPTYTSSSSSGMYIMFLRARSNEGCWSNSVQSSGQVNPYPQMAGAVSGPNNVCTGDNAVQYSISPLNNTDYYQWSFPSGVTGSSATNNIQLNFLASAQSGQVAIWGVNQCGYGIPNSVYVNVHVKPLPPTITLNGNILQSNSPTGNQWYNQNGIINGATAQTFTVTLPGTYYCIVSNGNCSSDPSNSIIVSFTDINHTDMSCDFSVFPNPAENMIMITSLHYKDLVSYEVLSFTGQKVLEGQFFESTVINIEHIAQGMYFLRLTYGDTVDYLRIMKQ